MYSSYVQINRSGLPHATILSGIFLATTLPAPIITLLPIVTLPNMIHPQPMNTSLPMLILPTLL